MNRLEINKLCYYIMVSQNSEFKTFSNCNIIKLDHDNN